MEKKNGDGDRDWLKCDSAQAKRASTSWVGFSSMVVPCLIMSGVCQDVVEVDFEVVSSRRRIVELALMGVRPCDISR